MRRHRAGFTLIEVLIVVVIMSILAAVIIPQFTETTQEAKASTAKSNLTSLRYQIETYKAQHGGLLPNATLSDLVIATTYRGKTYGPYMVEIPTNTLSGTNAVKAAAGSKVALGDITTGTGGGWVYSPATGDVRLDNVEYWQN